MSSARASARCSPRSARSPPPRRAAPVAPAARWDVIALFQVSRPASLRPRAGYFIAQFKMAATSFAQRRPRSRGGGLAVFTLVKLIVATVGPSGRRLHRPIQDGEAMETGGAPHAADVGRCPPRRRTSANRWAAAARSAPSPFAPCVPFPCSRHAACDRRPGHASGFACLRRNPRSLAGGNERQASRHPLLGPRRSHSHHRGGQRR